MNFTPVLLRQALMLGIRETVLIQLMNFTPVLLRQALLLGISETVVHLIPVTLKGGGLYCSRSDPRMWKSGMIRQNRACI